MMESENPGEETEESECMTHSELVTLTTKALNAVVQNDPLLCDLPDGVTLEEVSAQIAVLQGSALTIKVIRGDGETVKVVVERQGATVGHLKRAIQRQVALNIFRDTGRKRSISWRYVWKTYWLSHEGEKLKDDNALLINLGIFNKASVSFVKRYRDKQNETGYT